MRLKACQTHTCNQPLYNSWVTFLVLQSYLDCMSGLALLLFSLHFTALQQYSELQSMCFLCVPWPTHTILCVSGAQPAVCRDVCLTSYTPQKIDMNLLSTTAQILAICTKGPCKRRGGENQRVLPSGY